MNVTIDITLRSGIYCIKNILNGKVYIGHTQDLYKRNRSHFNALSIGKHHNRHLQSAYNLQNGAGLIYGILEFWDIVLCENKEQEWIQEYKSNDNNFGYNIRNHCSSNRGYKQTDYMRMVTSERTRGRVMSETTKEKLRIAFTGRKFSEETKDKLRRHNLTAEQLEKMAAPHRGKPSKKRLFNSEQIAIIKSSTEPSRAIGKKFGVSKTTILYIRSGKYYVN